LTARSLSLIAFAGVRVLEPGLLVSSQGFVSASRH
jgi:hypothetical protein